MLWKPAGQPLTLVNTAPIGEATRMHVVGMVLHPKRDSTDAVDAVLEWANPPADSGTWH